MAHTARSLVLGGVGLVGLVACGNGAKATTGDDDRTCATAEAIAIDGYLGTSLTSKKIALTFDDGPASRTSELSSYLAAQGIPAAFFVNGKHLPSHPGILAQFVADGHVIGNHTQDHVNLNDITRFPYNATGAAGIVAQLEQTDALIGPFVPAKKLMFRAPFGSFDFRGWNVVAASPMSKYVGHIHWDVGGRRTATTAADWACWQENPKLPTKTCGDLYLAEIESIGHGIVLMHDADYGNSNNHDVMTGLGNTVDMVKYIVPILKARGYQFVRVDTVPAIATALDPPPLPPPSDAGADASDGAVIPASSSPTPMPALPAAPAPPGAEPCSSIAAAPRADSPHAH